MTEPTPTPDSPQTPLPRAPRILIVSAAIGAGHDRPAEVLAQDLRDACPDATVEVVDGLAEMGPIAIKTIEDNSRIMFNRGAWLFDLQYALITHLAPTRWLMLQMTHALGYWPFKRLIARWRPDVVVSTYPGTTEILGWLRRNGKIDVPVCSAITDLAGLRYWSSRGVDLHMVIHPESIPEVRSIAGPGEITFVHGFSAPEFLSPVDPVAARRSLELPPDGPIVVVSGGGWGVGDLEGAVEVALEIPETFVVCLCGTSEELRTTLARRFEDHPRVRITGFTDQMCDLLTAADVLIHSTAGLTILEARMRGCQPISFGWGAGHIRANNEAYQRFGLADVALSRSELLSALRSAIATELVPDTSPRSAPSAASLVLALAGAGTREPPA